MSNNLAWKYYLQLEQDFLDTENYLAIDPINFESYSLRYLQLYLSIGSEIDIVFKEPCKNIDESFYGENITEYMIFILKCCNESLGNKQILLQHYSLVFSPWSGCLQNPPSSPAWWKLYNKIKHNRLSIEPNSGLDYYKLANQKNVLLALSALFSLHTCLTYCQHCIFSLKLEGLIGSPSQIKTPLCPDIQQTSDLFSVYKKKVGYSENKNDFIC